MFEKTIKDYELCINDALDAALPKGDNSRYALIFEAMRYSLMAGGKRIRPLLTLEFCRVCGGDAKKAMPFALAVEMIHSYSLIHDDLPCMDDDDMRRGKPSCHKKFGEANALLAGDALLTAAFEQISKADLPETARVKAAAVLSECAGASGMVGGQVIDLAYENKPMTEEILKEMFALKTGALLVAACKLGVLAAGGDETAIKTAGEYALSLGLAFQIVDDILDVTGNEAVLGKPIGSDTESGKTTYVGLCGLENAKKAAAYYTSLAKKSLESFEDIGFLSELTEYLLERDR